MGNPPIQQLPPGPLPEHPLDRALRELGEAASAQEKLELVWRTFETTKNSELERPPTVAERKDVLKWLRMPDQSGNSPEFWAKHPVLIPMLHGTVTEKASRITQLGCRVHVPSEAPVGPYKMSFPIGVEPWSAQSRRDKVAIREAVSAALRGKNAQLTPWGRAPLCLTVTALVSHAGGPKDVDNLIKGLLDAMQGYLYVDDRQIQCLTARRMEYAGDVGCYFVNVVPIAPWSNDVLLDDITPPHLSFGRVDWPPR